MDKKHNPKRLEWMNKDNLHDLNIQEARGWIIDMFGRIESRIDEYILRHFNPPNTNEFTRLILNSSILDVGKKLKILTNINVTGDKTIQKIRDLSSIRNAFAHTPIYDVYHIDVTIGNEFLGISGAESVLEIINGKGKIEQKSVIEYLKRFEILYKEICEELPIQEFTGDFDDSKSSKGST